VNDDTTRIVVKGMRPWDGEYELDTDRAFSSREWHWIKKVSGYLPLTVREGFAGQDPDLYVALALIAMCRNGRIQRDDWQRVAEQMAEAPFDAQSITLVGPAEAEVEDEIPPVLTSEPAGSSPTSSLENDSSGTPNPNSSGDPSKKSSDQSDVTLPRIGIGVSDISGTLTGTASAS
jgi:hypothetical protein